MSFKEITYVSRLHGEVYVHHNVETDAIEDVYTHRDNSMLRAASRCAWTPGRNPVFVHASHSEAAYDVIKDLGFQPSGEDA